MIRTIICFAALLFVIACAYYLPERIEQYKAQVVARTIP
jgi:hypothetical protein